jgi:DNA repair protein RecN (Recombination protein N)
MLTCLRIRDLAIIDNLELSFGPGLNVVTGETGAGKSILVDALELLLGGRGKPELVRTGAAQAEVEAMFELGDDATLRAKLQELELEAEGELVIRRVLQANGRTRAFLNGRMASTQQLGDLVRGLADISSQHEHHMLANASTHLVYLDAFARLNGPKARVGELYQALRKAHEALQAFEAQVKDRLQREDLLRYQIREIEAVSPSADEEAQLSESRDRLKHADTLARLSASAADALYERDESVSEVLSQVSASLAEAASLDPSLHEVVAQLETARTQLEEAARELGRYTRSVQADPERLSELDERLHALGKLRRKYGGSLTTVVEHLARARSELGSLEDCEGTRERLAAEQDRALRESAGCARELSVLRKAAADKLAHAIGSELVSLGMGGARIQVDVSPWEGKESDLHVDGARLTASGIDRVEFLIAPNKGEIARPLSKIASGGELSRAMLAIKRILAGVGPAGMYIFDEVDTGVGGAVAEVIGRKIQDVAQHRQVLCITHLPQIAVFADSHFKVEKTLSEGRTVSVVHRLGKREQEVEIARMLGGVKITAKTRAVAAEMLVEARGTAREQEKEARGTAREQEKEARAPAREQEKEARAPAREQEKEARAPARARRDARVSAA